MSISISGKASSLRDFDRGTADQFNQFVDYLSHNDANKGNKYFDRDGDLDVKNQAQLYATAQRMETMVTQLRQQVDPGNLFSTSGGITALYSDAETFVTNSKPNITPGSEADSLLDASRSRLDDVLQARRRDINEALYNKERTAPHPKPVNWQTRSFTLAGRTWQEIDWAATLRANPPMGIKGDPLKKSVDRVKKSWIKGPMTERHRALVQTIQHTRNCY